MSRRLPPSSLSALRLRSALVNVPSVSARKLPTKQTT
jgi:hypothetical protein